MAICDICADPIDLSAADPWRHLQLVRNIRSGAGFTLFDGQPYIWYSPVWYYLCAGLPSWFAMDWAAGLRAAFAGHRQSTSRRAPSSTSTSYVAISQSATPMQMRTFSVWQLTAVSISKADGLAQFPEKSRPLTTTPLVCQLLPARTSGVQ